MALKMDVIESTYGEICTVRMNAWRFGSPCPTPGHEHETLIHLSICIHCGACVQPTSMGPRTVHRILEWP